MIRIGFNARHLESSEMRGLTRYSVCLLRELSNVPDVELVLFSQRPLSQRHLVGIRAKTVVFPASRETLWNDWMLARRIRSEAIDVFHALADRGLPLQHPSPLVVTVHDSYERAHWRELYPGLKRAAYYWKHELINNRRADLILTVSATTRRALISSGVADEGKLRFIHLAPAPEFEPLSRERDQEVLTRLGVSTPYLLYVGGYDRRKNVDALVRAFSAASLGTMELVMVGSKSRPEFAGLNSAWDQLPRWEHVRLIESEPCDLPALYRQADLFVNPSLWESFSFQVVEALASGTPLLASNRTAIPEIAGGAALLFDPEDLIGLARLMETVAVDAVLKAQLREKGLKRARDFSWQKTTEQTLTVYRELVEHASQ